MINKIYYNIFLLLLLLISSDSLGYQTVSSNQKTAISSYYKLSHSMGFFRRHRRQYHRTSYRKLIGPLENYKKYLLTEGNLLITSVKRLNKAVMDKKIDQAKLLFQDASIHYKKLELMIKLYPTEDIRELEKRINCLEEDFAIINDSRFTGFHRVERELFCNGKFKDLKKYVKLLETDVTILANKIKYITISPKNILTMVPVFVNVIIPKKINGKEDIYAHNDLADAQANLDTLKTFFKILNINEINYPTLMKDVFSNFADVYSILKKFMLNNRFMSCMNLDAFSRYTIKSHLREMTKHLMFLPKVLID